MGSRITRSVYKRQRAAHPTQDTSKQAIRFFSLFLCLLLAFAVGYAHQIDRILIMINSPHYKPDPIFEYVEVVITVLGGVGVGLLLSLVNFTVLIMKCTFGCALSQLLVIFSFGRLGMPALYVGEILLDVNSIGVIMSIFSLIRVRCVQRDQVLWGALALGCLDLGLHWSYIITPLAHDNSSAKSAYYLSALFLVLATLGSFILVVTQGIFKEQKSHQLHPKNFNRQSIKIMFESRIRGFLKIHAKKFFLPFASGFALSLMEIDVSSYTTYHLYANMALWAVLVVLFYLTSSLKDQYQWLLHSIILGIFTPIGLSNSGQIQKFILLLVLHYSRIGNFLSINFTSDLINYPIGLGFYFAASALGTLTRAFLQPTLNQLFLAGLITTIQFAWTYKYCRAQQSLSQEHEQQMASLNSS